MMPHILAVLEQRGGVAKKVSQETLAAARSLADDLECEVHGLLIGPPNMKGDGLGEYGADKVLTSLDGELELYQASRYGQVAAEQATAGEYAAIVVAATSLGKDLGPRIAARLGCTLASDVTGISGSDGIAVSRPAFSGKAIYRIKITTRPCVISIRPNAFSPILTSHPGTIEEVSAGNGGKASDARTVAVKAPEHATMDVAEASIVVSGGRGLREAEHFKLVEELAQALGGAVGASRAVVDAGWRPHAEQVGQTGKTVSPNLYIALGISGAIQHLAGMRTAKVIVAVNKDADAPIFKVADYGIVGDVFEVVPRLTEEIKKAKDG
ncbi:MAG: electron transfer flavoprotein subunit alpha/FixB family protein [Gemmatimonadota bacterium]|nr:MAG: electron transfer flavoprotein subunit alpha/FixB family protein [Gemmatimonadota bacterium]